jgi:hypothetical protein
MNQINVVTIGKLIEAHREGDEQKFKTYKMKAGESHDFNRGRCQFPAICRNHKAFLMR